MKKIKNLVKKGGVADVVTIIVIVGLVIALIMAVVIPLINKTEETESNREAEIGAVDTYVNSRVESAIGFGEEEEEW